MALFRKKPRPLTEDELKDIYIEEDSIKGCIARMCVTHEIPELNDMYKWAVLHLRKIYWLSKGRFSDEDRNDV